ncbi:hypothetical protein QE152_g33577 [Popillia japonica]|uniref:Uncharacterized protein n=1 Tax=Popillia japonica TaxID=7064 RepID=A0AAW1IWC5_POPJA
MGNVRNITEIVHVSGFSRVNPVLSAIPWLAYPHQQETVENLRTEEELEKVVREFDIGKQPQPHDDFTEAEDDSMECLFS